MTLIFDSKSKWSVTRPRSTCGYLLFGPWVHLRRVPRSKHAPHANESRDVLSPATSPRTPHSALRTPSPQVSIAKRFLKKKLRDRIHLLKLRVDATGAADYAALHACLAAAAGLPAHLGGTLPPECDALVWWRAMLGAADGGVMVARDVGARGESLAEFPALLT